MGLRCSGDDLMANTFVETDINGIPVWCEVYAEPYVPARLSGHPDSWTPAEGGEIDIEEVFVKLKGKALINGQWIQCDKVAVDILPLLSDDAFELLTDKCYESLNQDQD